jgi:hypothetical protein
VPGHRGATHRAPVGAGLVHRRRVEQPGLPLFGVRILGLCLPDCRRRADRRVRACVPGVPGVTAGRVGYRSGQFGFRYQARGDGDQPRGGCLHDRRIPGRQPDRQWPSRPGLPGRASQRAAAGARDLPAGDVDRRRISVGRARDRGVEPTGLAVSCMERPVGCASGCSRYLRHAAHQPDLRRLWCSHGRRRVRRGGGELG